MRATRAQTNAKVPDKASAASARRRGLTFAFALSLFSCGMRVSSPENVESITCLHAMDCPTSSNPCVVSTCYEQHCLMVSAAAQTVLPQQAPGDCKMRVCDGNGGVSEINDDIDVPTGNENDCTRRACKEGAAVDMPVEVGETCGHGGVCNGKGACGVCIPGQSRCEPRSLLTCNEEGQWDEAACPLVTPLCEGQACIGPNKLITGPYASCAHFSNATVRCFGAEGFNAQGGKTSVNGLRGAAELALGQTFGCARFPSGEVRCWGDNRHGQVGDGTTQSPKPPTPVLGLPNATAIAAGDAFACAITNDGKVYCWGKGEHGELGSPAKPQPIAKKNPNPEPEEAPSPGGPPSLANQLRGSVSIALGGTFGCAIFPGANVQCFGQDSQGELGQTEAEPQAKPKPGPKPKPSLVQVKGIEGAIAIALGSRHACALLADQTAKCWGENTSGELGDGTTEKRIGPVAVKNLERIASLALGESFSCALLENKTAQCWGNNTHGKLGDGTEENRLEPVSVKNLANIKKIMAKGSHVCAETVGPAYQCWGQNTENELGDGTTNDQNHPVPVRW